MGMTPNLSAKAVLLVLQERQRQDQKWGVQRHPMGEWMMILQEELGEFAQACQKGSVQYKESDAQDRIVELTQVVAVGLAMLEQLIEEKDKKCFNCGVNIAMKKTMYCERCNSLLNYVENK